MNVASVELCKELYELSGWGSHGPDDATDKIWFEGKNNNWMPVGRTHFMDNNIPAYDLGYLLRKLPHHCPLEQNGMTGHWVIRPNVGHPRAKDFISADTPEDAVCKLAIELFKRGILKGERDDCTYRL